MTPADHQPVVLETPDSATKALARFLIDEESHTPIYRQIVDQVKRRVAGGELAQGAELPSVRVVASLLALTPMTVSKAYGMLKAEGVLVYRRGRRMTIAPQPTTAIGTDERLQQVNAAVRDLVRAAVQLRLARSDLTHLICQPWDAEG
jgi:GntR family transcriptional regulator